MPLPPRYSVYLFDVDGPLVNSVEPALGATRMVLDHFELPSLDIDEWRQLNKPPYEQFWKNLGVPKEDVKTALSLYSTFFNELRHTTTQPLEVLYTLKALRSKHIGVVTDGSRRSWEKNVEMFGLDEYVSVAITRDDCPERKPLPNPLLLAMERLGLPKKRIREHRVRGLMIGDTAADITAGRNAGLDTAAIIYVGSYNNKERLEVKEPTFLIPRLDIITRRNELKNYQINPSRYG